MQSLPVFTDLNQLAELTQLQIGAVGQLTGSEAYHAVKVKRLRPGEYFDLVDTRGLRLTAKVLQSYATGREAQLEYEVLGKQQDTCPSIALGIVQALAKNGRDEQSVEAAIELGVTQIWPWMAERCIVQWKAKKIKSGQQKWQDLGVAAAKQSRRSYWPKVQPLVDTQKLAGLITEEKEKRHYFLILDADAQLSLKEAYNECVEARQVTVIVGPEGGISENEMEVLVSAGAIMARLGSTVLRSSSAGPAALAALALLTGSWD